MPTDPVPIETRYRPLIELGRGGTARVYLAQSLSGLKKLVVLKILEPEISADEEMRNLFRREAEVCARLNHPSIVQVNEVVEQANGPVIVMEYVEGVALSHVIAQCQGRFPKRLHLHILTELLAGLHYFHELRDYDRTTALKPVHRDVSPQNVIVMYEGAVKVLDFGIAKLANQDNATATGIIKGKLHYMPSEQLLSESSLDRRADIFSAGIMLWEALAERRIWQDLSENDHFKALICGELPKLRSYVPDLPEHFYAVVAKATAHLPEDRYSTALELQLEIEKMLGDVGGLVQPRELAKFIQTEFAEWRKKQDAAILDATEYPVSAKWRLPTSEVQACAEPEPERSDASRRTAAVTVITTEASSSRRSLLFGLVGLLLLLLVLGGMSLLRNQRKHVAPFASAPSASSPSLRMINIAVTSNPTGAWIVLDGQPLGRTPWRGTLPAKQQAAILELRADGYEPMSKVVSLADDAVIHSELRPLPRSVQPESATTERKFAKDRAAKPTADKPASKDMNCQPPYTLSSDGIRVYKPECF